MDSWIEKYRFLLDELDRLILTAASGRLSSQHRYGAGGCMAIGLLAELAHDLTVEAESGDSVRGTSGSEEATPWPQKPDS
jgi:hypothetical protein